MNQASAAIRKEPSVNQLNFFAEGELRQVADVLPQMVWITAPSGATLYFNARWYEYTGLREDESLGNNWVQAFHPADAARTLERWQQSLDTGEPYEIEYRCRGRDGQYRWFLGRGLPVRDAEGNISKWFGTCTDIHDKMLTELQLRDNMEFTRSVLESSTDGIKVLDLSGRLISMNKSGAEHLEVDDVLSCIGKDWIEFWKDESRAKAERAVKEALADRTAHFEGSRDTLKGTPKWWEVIVSPIHDSSGNIHRILVVSRDVTERQAQAQELRQREEQFSELANALPQIVWMTGADGSHDYYNQRWYEYTGFTADQSVGSRWGIVVHPADEVRCWERWQYALKTGAPYEIEYRLRRHDGEYRWFLGRGVPVRDDQGTIVKWFGTCTDVHDKILLEHNLRQAIEQAEAASLAKSEFLANISHEIRTPMNAVVGLANILSASSPLTDKQREYVSTLQLSAEQMLQLINDLLDMSRLESKGLHLEAIPFDLNKLVDDIVSINSVTAREKRIVLERRGECRHQLVGDPLRLKQIIMNLVGNAVKFTDEGSVSVNIFATPREGKSLVDLMIAVEDTGIGIPDDKLETIFSKFSQVDSSTSRLYGGSGLGLAISKTLVELMGGKVTVNSVKGKGSCFTVTLALPSVRTESMKETRQSVEAVPQPKAAAAPSAFKVLLVEDYQANILVATMLLESFGYDYDLARSGEEALAELEKNEYGVILMDVQMPQMNGYQATAVIREREAAGLMKKTPIVGMTAHAMKGDRERCLEAGMDDYMSKPFRPETLQTIIEKYASDAVATA